MKHVLLIAAGLIFTLLGLVGLLLPFMPGFVFLIIAALSFAVAFPGLRRRMESHPRLRRLFQRLDAGAGLAIIPRCQLAFWALLEAANPQRKPCLNPRTDQTLHKNLNRSMRIR